MSDLISTSSSCAHENDTISRRAAIDVIYKCTDIFINNLPPMIEKEDAYKALAALPSVQSEQHWILCSRKVPEERGMYLTTTIDKEVYCDFWNGVNFGRTELVIAWRPLPEPYEGDNDGTNR